MRRIIAAAFVAVLAIAFGCCLASAEDTPVKVYINSIRRWFDPSALVRDGTTYVPLRAGAESIGAQVKWEEKSKTAVITLDGRTTRIKQSQGIMVDNRLLIPLRRMAEALDCEVVWDAKAQAVRIDNGRCGPVG